MAVQRPISGGALDELAGIRPNWNRIAASADDWPRVLRAGQGNVRVNYPDSDDAQAARKGLPQSRAAAAAAQVADGPSTFDTALDTAQLGTTIAGMGMFLGVPVYNAVIPGSLGLAGKGASWVTGSETGLGLKTASDWAKRPTEWLEKTTVSEVPLPGKARIGTAIQSGVNATAPRIGAALDWTGLPQWRAEAYQRKSESLYKQLTQSASEMEGSWGGRRFLKNSGGRNVVGAVLDTVNRHGSAHADVREALNEMHRLVEDAGSHANVQWDRIADLNHQIEHMDLSAASQEVKNATKDLLKSDSVKKMRNLAEKAGDFHAQSQGWRKPAESLRNIPKAIGKGSVRQTVMDGAFIAGDALSLVGVARDAMKINRELNAMDQDLRQAGVGHSEALASERRKAALQTGIKTVIHGASLTAMLKQVSSKHVNPILFFAPAIAGEMLDRMGVLEKSPLKQHYNDLNRAVRQGTATVEDYAKLLSASSPTFQNLGTGSPIMAAVARKLHEGKVSAAETLKMAENGELTKMADQLVVESKKYAHQGAWQQRVKSGHQPAMGPVVGDGVQTGALARRATQPASPEGAALGGV